MPVPPFTAVVDTLPETVPFVGPEAIERKTGIKTRARIGANESVFGPSPKALQAIRDNADTVWSYGDPENYELQHALAAKFGVSPEEITIGEGIDGLMSWVVRLFIAPGDKVVMAAGGYPTFIYHVSGYGGELHYVPYMRDHEDPIALASKAREVGAKMVYLANPDNPMGTWWPAETIQAFIDAVPEDCVIVLDEAYGECAPDGTMPAIDTSRANVLRMRTFSKAYGLAGMRCGYAIGNARLTRAFNRIRNHFGVTRLTQAAALAALQDEEHLNWALASIDASRERLYAIAKDNGLEPIPSATNFVTIDCMRDGAFAKAVLDALAEQGVFIRKPGSPGHDRCIRVSCGPEREMDIFAQALPLALKQAQGVA